MSKPNYQKIKLLKLLEIFRHDTDEDNPLKTSELCSKLNELNISCDRRTLSKDIGYLNEHGYEIMETMSGHEKAYYVAEGSFSIPELKILIDAVQAASFITKKKTDELIFKIANLGGSHQARLLTENMVCFNTCKHSNESIYYNIGFLEEAILKKKKVSFIYFDLDENTKKTYRKDKQKYITEPVALIFNEDNYYLMCYSPKYKDIVNYRLDRMECVEVLEDDVCEYVFNIEEDVARHTKQSFKMFRGEQKDIVLLFERSLIGSVFDKFGEETKMERLNEDTAIAAVKVQTSPTFWGWIFQFAGKMKIISPQSAIDEYNSHHKESLI